jgi:serine/threonine protein kinase
MDIEATKRGELPSTCPQCSHKREGTIDDSVTGFTLCPQCGSAHYRLTVDLAKNQPYREPVKPQLPARFHIGKLIGQGTFGLVFEGFDTLLNREVAIKSSKAELSDEDIALFVREARAASRIRHPNIVTVHDVVTHEQNVAIISDLVQGQTLREWIETTKPDFDQSINLIVRICRAIDCAHRSGIVHRDLKPGNIVIDEQGEPHILDFGLSQSCDQSLESLAQDGIPIGTPAFMAPEQVIGNRDKIDRRADVYSIGIILYLLLAGRLPFVGERKNPKELYRKIMCDLPPPIRKFAPEIPKSLEAICLKSIRKRREERYPTAGELADDLDRFRNGQIVKAHGKLDAKVLTTILRRRSLALICVLLALGASLLGYFALINPRDQPTKVKVLISSVPANAELHWTRYDQRTGLLEMDSELKSIAGTPVSVAPGFYRIIARRNSETREVFRTIPSISDEEQYQQVIFHGATVTLSHRNSSRTKGGHFELDPIQFHSEIDLVPRSTMFPAGKLTMAASGHVVPLFLGQTQSVQPFQMMQSEVKWSELKQAWPKLVIPSDQHGDQPASGLGWDVATAFAELSGMNLPSVWEFKFAATNGGTTAYPGGDEISTDDPFQNWESGKWLDWDRNLSTPPIQGLFSGWDEWTDTPFELLLVRDNKLVPALPTAGRGSFPEAWYAVATSTAMPDDRLVIEKCLRSIRKELPTPAVGFRLVRRQHRFEN